MTENDKIISLGECAGFGTNTDQRKISEKYATKTRGFRYRKSGTLCQQDFGTKAVFPYYPTSNLTPNTLTILDGYTVYDPDTATEHFVVAFIDSANQTHLYVYRKDTGTSGSTVSIGTGSKSFTAADLPLTCVGDWAMVYNTSDPTKYMIGKITESSGVGGFTLNVLTTSGSGSYSDWTIEIGWAEMSRTLVGQVFGTPSAGAKTVSLLPSSIKENGVVYVPSTDEFLGWIALNTKQTSTPKTISAATRANPANITATGHGLATGDIVIITGTKVQYGDGPWNGIWKITKVDADNFTIGENTTLNSNYDYVSGGTVQKFKTSFLVSSSTATDLTSLTTLGSNGISWADKDDIVLYRNDMMLYGFNRSLGETPFFNFGSVDSQKKLTIAHGADYANPERPVQIVKRASRVICTDGSSPSTLQSGWYADVHQPSPYITSNGSMSQEGRYFNGGAYFALSALLYEKESTQPWGWIRAHVVQTATPVSGSMLRGYPVDLYMYATVMFADYQESDPIWEGYFAATSTNYVYLDNARIHINPAMIRKDITKIRFYSAYTDETNANAGLWSNVGGASFKLIKEINLRTAPLEIFDATQRGGMIYGAYLILPSLAPESNSIVDNLGRAVSKARTLVKPRYVSQVSLDQGAVNAIDEGSGTNRNQVIRLSAYSGAGAHADDIFPDLTTDTSGRLMRVKLIGRGEILGMTLLPKVGIETVAGALLVFRQGTLEIFNLVQNQSIIFPADTVSRSIKSMPFGVPYAGASGIFLIDKSLDIKMINTSWMNFWNGDLKTPEGVSYINDEARAGALFGYDPSYQEILVQVQVNVDGGGTENLTFRYSPAEQHWSIRKWNIGTSYEKVRCFISKLDNTLAIGHSSALLGYPYKDAHEDDVTYFGVSQSKAIPHSAKINIGSLTSIEPLNVFDSVLMAHRGSVSSGSQALIMNFYANGHTSPFATKTFPIGGRPRERKMPPRGKIEQLEVELILPSVVTVKGFEASEILMKFIKAARYALT